MSKKVYVVKMYYNDRTFEEKLHGPIVESVVLNIFASKKDAEKWIDSRFIGHAKDITGFCDFQIAEMSVKKDFYEGVYETFSNEWWVSATVDADLRDVRISGFGKGDEKLYAYYDPIIKRYYLRVRLPENLHTRTEVIDYLKKKAGEIKK